MTHIPHYLDITEAGVPGFYDERADDEINKKELEIAEQKLKCAREEVAKLEREVSFRKSLIVQPTYFGVSCWPILFHMAVAASNKRQGLNWDGTIDLERKNREWLAAREKREKGE